MTIFLNLTEVRNNFPQLIKKITKGDNVIITRRGKVVAFISSLNEADIETDAILKNPRLMKKIKKAKEDVSADRLYSYENVFGSKK